MKGSFVVFEGVDGSGTSTQARLLHERLLRSGSRVQLTSEPTTGPVGSLIRNAMKHRLLLTNDHAGDDRQLAYLFAADRYDHLFNAVDGLVGLLARGTHVISTRYFLSSFAYHCDSEETFHLVQRLNADFPLPDITFFLDTPVAMCLERIHRGRVVPEKYENERKLLDVRRRYEEAIQRLNMSVIVLDGRERIDTLAAKVHEHVEERMQHVKR